MKTITLTCEHCGVAFERQPGQYKYHNIKKGGRIFCSKACKGLSRRVHKTKAEKKEEKRLYDIAYRERNLDRKKAQAARYFQEVVKPSGKDKEWRAKRMPKHIEYCRQPEYRAKKQKYDQRHRAEKFYGEYADVAIARIALEQEIRARADKVEIATQNQTLNKSQQRRKHYGTNSK